MKLTPQGLARLDAMADTHLVVRDRDADGIAGDQVQQSVGYLVMLRRALAAPRGDDVAARQFGIVHAIGRGERALSLDFVSDWHCW